MWRTCKNICCRRNNNVATYFFNKYVCMHLHLGEALHICMTINDNVSKSTCQRWIFGRYKTFLCNDEDQVLLLFIHSNFLFDSNIYNYCQFGICVSFVSLMTSQLYVAKDNYDIFYLDISLDDLAQKKNTHTFDVDVFLQMVEIYF